MITLPANSSSIPVLGILVPPSLDNRCRLGEYPNAQGMHNGSRAPRHHRFCSAKKKSDLIILPFECSINLAVAAAFNMLPHEVVKPIILLLGEVVLAHTEWNSLSKIAELRVRRSSYPKLQSADYAK